MSAIRLKRTMRDDWNDVPRADKQDSVKTRQERERTSRGYKPWEYPRFFFRFHVKKKGERDVVTAMAYSTKRAKEQAKRYADVTGTRLIRVEKVGLADWSGYPKIEAQWLERKKLKPKSKSGE